MLILKRRNGEFRQGCTHYNSIQIQIEFNALQCNSMQANAIQKRPSEDSFVRLNSIQCVIQFNGMKLCKVSTYQMGCTAQLIPSYRFHATLCRRLSAQRLGCLKTDCQYRMCNYQRLPIGKRIKAFV